MTYKEIGSEFWIADDPLVNTSERDGIYVLSGRTAIDLIIMDIKSRRKVSNVYMPSYCCDSMITPFLYHNIRVDFYDMSFDGKLNYALDTDKNVDILCVSNYFGYENTLSDELIHHFKENGTVVLYDRTHSYLMGEEIRDADYTFVSLRKWMGVVTGAKVEGLTTPVNLQVCPYSDVKALAMRDKYRYLCGDLTANKTAFLDAFAQFGHELEGNYHNYGMDDLSYALYKAEDWGRMRERRRTNAAFIHENLSVDFLGELSDEACPMFVPVIFKSHDLREKVRKTLIEKQIYCPAHWPKNRLVTPEMKVNQLFDCELSLICDQRYGLEEMDFIVKKIQNVI